MKLLRLLLLMVIVSTQLVNGQFNGIKTFLIEKGIGINVIAQLYLYHYFN